MTSFFNILKFRALSRTNLRQINAYRFCSTIPNECDAACRPDPEADIESLFLDSQVQTLLKRMTGLDLEKVYARQRVIPEPVPLKMDYYKDYLLQFKSPKNPEYKFMTKEEYEKTYEQYKRRAMDTKLQMPPVMKSRKPADKFIRRDPELQDYDRSNYVFIDVTYGLRENDRVILVREPEGSLRTANWDERDRMNRIYNPLPGRMVDMPRMFHPEHLETILDKEEYIFILSRNCLQFNPNDPHFIRVAKRTYDHIDQRGKYDILRSTRFFGPMAFYLATESTIDGLMVDMLNRELLEDAGDLVRLHHITRDSSASPPQLSPLDLVKDYVANHSTRKAEVDLAIQRYQELLRIRHQEDSLPASSSGHQ